MIAATLYVIGCTAKNRLRRRLSRLREPRYAMGAIVGGAYMYFVISSRMRGGRRRPSFGPDAAANPAAAKLLAFAPTLGGVALLLLAAVSAALPMSARPLAFSRSETEFLFPAPVTKRQLLGYRLLRSQSGIFMGAVIFGLLYPAQGIAGRLASMLGVFIMLATIRFFSVGVALTQQRARMANGRDRQLARLPLLIIVLAAAIVLAPALRVLLSSGRLDVTALSDQAWSDGPAYWILQPALWLIQPLFATSLGQFRWGLPLAALVCLATLGWVLSGHETFAQMSDGEVDRQEAEPRPTRRGTTYRAGSAVWTLAPSGRPEAAFAWKAAQQMFRGVNRRVWIRLTLAIVWMAVVVASIGSARGISQALGIMTTMLAAIAVLMGPQIYRADLRQDLAHLDTLKTWPVRSASVIRGEMLWPVIVVTAVAWMLGGLALILSASTFARSTLAWRAAVSASAFVMAPILILGQYTVHAALTLLFPAWVPSGDSTPRGIDAMGQRMILLGGTMLTLIVALLPAVLVGAILYFALYKTVGPWFLIPSAIVGAITTTLEALIATEALGPLYEKLDLAGVERAE